MLWKKIQCRIPDLFVYCCLGFIESVLSHSSFIVWYWVFKMWNFVWSLRFAKVATFVLHLFLWNTAAHVYMQLMFFFAKITLWSEFNFCYSLNGAWISLLTCPYSYERTLVQTFSLVCHGHNSFGITNYSPLHNCYYFI